MKKLLFGLTFLGSMMMTGVSFEAKADPGDPGDGGNSYGGVCCQTAWNCRHPYAGLIADAMWNSDIAYCP